MLLHSLFLFLFGLYCLPFPTLKSLSEQARLIEEESSICADIKLLGFPKKLNQICKKKIVFVLGNWVLVSMVCVVVSVSSNSTKIVRKF